MKRKNESPLGELLREFFEENPELFQKISEARVVEEWKTMFGSEVFAATSNIYIKNRVLYVSLRSSVIRNELMMCRERIVSALNNAAKASVIDSIVLR